jgi:WD40 repeat protein
MKILKGHSSRVNDLAFSPDGTLLASCSTDGTLRLWDTLSGEGRELNQPRDASTYLYTAVAISPDGENVLALTYRGGLQVWSVSHSRPVTHLIVPDRLTSVAGFAVAPHGGLVVATQRVYSALGGLPEAVLHLWESQTWKKQVVDLGASGQARGVCFDPSGAFLATEAGLFNLRSGSPRQLARTKFPAEQLRWSPTSPLLAGATRNVITLWDARSRGLLRKLYLERKQVQDFAFSPDGAYLAAVSNEEIVRIWDARTWAEREGYAWQIGELKCLAFAPDGLRAACGSQRGTILVWDWDL